MKGRPVLLTMALVWLLVQPLPAFAAKWWNPFTWFDRSESAQIENENYRIERKEMVSTLAEAKQTGDPETIRQAQKELRDFDKAHKKRIQALRKETQRVMKAEHKAGHKSAQAQKRAAGFVKKVTKPGSINIMEPLMKPAEPRPQYSIPRGRGRK